MKSFTYLYLLGFFGLVSSGILAETRPEEPKADDQQQSEQPAVRPTQPQPSEPSEPAKPSTQSPEDEEEVQLSLDEANTDLIFESITSWISDKVKWVTNKLGLCPELKGSFEMIKAKLSDDEVAQLDGMAAQFKQALADAGLCPTTVGSVVGKATSTVIKSAEHGADLLKGVFNKIRPGTVE
jgi:hypothetical protein